MRITTNIPGPGTVGTAQLQDLSVTAAKLAAWQASDFARIVAALSIAAGQIQDNVITDTQVAVNGLTTNSIAALGRMEVYTASGSFTAKKTGPHLLIMIGGGSGGGGGAGSTAVGGLAGSEGGMGGMSGQLLVTIGDLVAADVYPFVVGAGGAGGGGGVGGANGSNSTAGGYTTFNNGAYSANPGPAVYGGLFNTFSLAHGQRGESGYGLGAGRGGATVAGASNGNAGLNATGPGAGGGGGGGAASNNSTNNGGAGGSGSPGLIILLW